MTSPKACILAAVAGVLSTGAAFADPSTDLQQQVTELQGQVSQLQARQAQNSKEVSATIEQVLRDAEHRSNLLAAGGGGAGYDNGFFIKSGDFELRPGILFQFWNVTDYRSNTGGPKDDEIENGFEVHRLEFSLNGTAFTKDLAYSFMWITGQDESGLNLLDAYVQYMFADDWGFRAGQVTENFSHEDFLGDGVQLAADRSMLDVVLSGYTGRVQQFSMLYGNYNDKNPFNAEVGLTDGAGSINSNYVGHYPSDPGTVGGPVGPSNHAFDFGMYARAEWKAMGSWKNYSDFTAMGTKEDLFVLGGAVDWSQGGNGDVLGLTVDAQFETASGFGLYGAAVYRNADSDSSITGGDMDDWGLLIQASYLINPAWEIFGRYDVVFFDENIIGDEDTFHELTVGVNYYLGNNGSAGHRAKVTVDLNWLFNGAPGPLTGIGYLGDNAADTEVVLRGAFQLAL